MYPKIWSEILFGLPYFRPTLVRHYILEKLRCKKEKGLLKATKSLPPSSHTLFS